MIGRSVAPLRFPRDESGNITVFSVFMLVLILTITGASVDIMRHEASRARLQTTLDRAVLAAADLDQPQSAEDVVWDYVYKAELQDYLENVQVETGLNARTVSALGDASQNTIFLNMAGHDRLEGQVLATAEERIANVEISMVLDVSGSMNGEKIANLKDAAKEFVDTVIVDSTESSGLTSINVVPYNATVNIGDTLAPYWSFESDSQEYSHCVIFEDHEFDAVTIYPWQTLVRLAHFDLYTTSTSTTQIPSPWCRTGDQSAVIIHSTDTQQLKDHIDSFQAGGNTAIDLGVKWGAALLDPAARPVVANLAADGLIDEDVAERPADFDDLEAVKFLVVMTDGANTTEYDLKPEFKSGMSDVWIDDRGNTNPSDDRFSVLVDDNSGSGNDVWFWERYENENWSTRYRNSIDGGGNARRMSNHELYARFGVKAIARKFWHKPEEDNFISGSRYNQIYYGYRSIVNSSLADSRLSDICQATRDAGIVVFAIAFEAPQGGKDALQDCASSASHYFDVEGVEITETFHAIARQINNLRLIQ